MRDAGAAVPPPSFAHASEAELARILDFYEVRWAYEPDTFPIAWNLDGDVIESFSPDFYLPDLELYVELTTLKQTLVRKKNRKLRRLRELYPDIRIKLFYARDFRMLMLKFGRLALIDELTGTTGQATPPRGAEGAGESVGVPAPASPADRASVGAAASASPSAEPGPGHEPAALDDGPDALHGEASAPLRSTAREGRGRRRGRRRRHAATAPGLVDTAADAAAHADIP